MTLHANPYAGKKTVVLGLGRSGMAAARLLRKSGADVVVCESSESERMRERAALLQAEGIKVLLGNEAEKDSTKYDLAILSPGIEERVPLVTNVAGKGIALIGELELAYSLSNCPIIAITGTNGKTTTTELTTRMLQGAGLRTAACGNIGTPMSEMVSFGEVWDVLVVEVSSFQLERIVTFCPKVALWLNLSPNHLDRYSSMEEYRNAKLRIFENQQESDWAVVASEAKLPPLKAKKLTFSTQEATADLSFQNGCQIVYRNKVLLDFSRTQLRGPHNAANIMAAFGAGIALGADLSAMASAILDYTPPAHRCEFIAERAGVRWINDSKATNLNAMEQAICSVKGPLILIAGGKDKGFEFAPSAELVKERVSCAILIGEMRHRIARDWASVATLQAETLEEAVNLALSKASPGSTVLFSPGTSSFDMFRDYVERGEAFRRFVERLPEENFKKS